MLTHARGLSSQQEMIKGIRRDGTKEYLSYYDTLRVPIIENTAQEEDLTERMKAAMIKYPVRMRPLPPRLAASWVTLPRCGV